MSLTPQPRLIRHTVALATSLACLACWAPQAQADERESLETLRQTTLGLIDALVDQGVISRAKADAMLQSAKGKATAQLAANPAPAPAAKAAPTVRVPYVPQNVKDQLRNEIREEVVAQARAERWGVPNSSAAWTDRIKIEGDLRLRYQADRFGKDNSSVNAYADSLYTSALSTRAADFNNLSTNVEDNRSRLRLRARLDVTAKVSDHVATSLRISTGSATDRVSTNQTLGQDFNKYTLLLDRAFVKVDPTEWLSISGGRIPNPWFNTDMVWSDNLNFEGLAMTARWPTELANGWQPFATLGAFPIREDAPPSRQDRWLYGVQVGANWQINAQTQVKFGVAQYQYKNLEGRKDPDFTFNGGAGASYGQYEYGKNLRQKGNTLFFTNNELDGLNSGVDAGLLQPDYLGLASRFEPLTLTVAARFAQFSPYSLMVSGEYVTNTAYDESEIRARTQLDNVKGRKDGYHLKVAFGEPVVQQLGDWQASLSYRWIGSDAVLDAFTDSDLGLGGTNLRGFTLGLQYGVDRNSAVGIRYLNARQIDSFAVNGNQKFSADSLQVEFNVRF